MSRNLENLYIPEYEKEKIQASVGYICAECNQKAYYFNTKNRQLDSGMQCLICSEIRPDGILVEDFESTLRRHLRDHYTLGDSRSTDTISLKDVLKRFTYDNEDFLELLAAFLCQPHDPFFRKGGWYRNIVDEDFITRNRADALREWEGIANELKNVRRFNHAEACGYYAALIGSCFHQSEEEQGRINLALTFLQKGEVLYRGRIAWSNEQKMAFLSDPVKELSAPPNHLAANSRMSPPGISFLYTAGDYKTAIAELHPFVGDTVAIGQFVTTRELRFFDFTRLEKMVYADARILDNPTKHKTFRNRYLMSSLHHLIAKPLRANDTSYIETQVFAEVISSYTGEKYDGILFGSSQRPGGFNYVIFGDIADADDLNWQKKEYHVEFNHETGVKLYKVEKIRAQAEEVPHSDPVVS